MKERLPNYCNKTINTNYDKRRNLIKMTTRWDNKKMMNDKYSFKNDENKIKNEEICNSKYLMK